MVTPSGTSLSQRNLKIAICTQPRHVDVQANQYVRGLSANTHQRHLDTQQTGRLTKHNQAIRHLLIEHGHASYINQKCARRRMVDRLQRLIAHIDEFKFKEIFTIGDFFEVEPQVMINLVLKQYLAARKVKKKVV